MSETSAPHRSQLTADRGLPRHKLPQHDPQAVDVDLLAASRPQQHFWRLHRTIRLNHVMWTPSSTSSYVIHLVDVRKHLWHLEFTTRHSFQLEQAGIEPIQSERVQTQPIEMKG